ncbi:hypothetical protein OG884_05585 [Streptosporangium sp. NBC_01755]|uniref:hypothetical protein n=1 Tax=Streptosporangium sp. NBC_01755 TaxID=2975949 RepID=UPI002DD8BDBC|nr:hypothetical protein [Streptosporangium sp. NBC_01755]WSD01396.1 hypothetical protein OG884_05585 [Streptosporangium sp. NBC_01755]
MRMTRDVLRLLRVRDFRGALPPLRDGEESAILVSFLDDTLKSVMKRIALLGGNVNVVVPPEDLADWPTRMTFLQVTTGGRVAPGYAMTDNDCLVNEHSELGMLLELLRVRRRTMTFHLCKHETTVELVDDGKDSVPV